MTTPTASSLLIAGTSRPDAARIASSKRSLVSKMHVRATASAAVRLARAGLVRPYSVGQAGAVLRNAECTRPVKVAINGCKVRERRRLREQLERQSVAGIV